MAKILVIGGLGQIGSELSVALRRKYGKDNVVVADIRKDVPKETLESGPYEPLDVLDREGQRKAMERHGIDTVYQLASLLSATGEKNPDAAFSINLQGLKNTLDSFKELGVEKIFWPSSIAAFGPTTPREETPQRTVLEPTTMYGVTKVAGELLMQYYHLKYGLDTRSVRYPGLISWKTPPGGGTTDYAVAMFYEALLHKAYTCFVGPYTTLPMMYMPDAIRGTIELMDAQDSKIQIRTSYNLAAISFSAEELAAEVGRLVKGFKCSYEPDARQKIADSWPRSIDDSAARSDWGWSHKYNLRRMSEDMVANLKVKLKK